MKNLLVMICVFAMCAVPSALLADEPNGVCEIVRPGLRFEAIARQHPDWIGQKMPKDEVESLWQVACRTVICEDNSLETNLKVNSLEKKTARLVRSRATNILFELVTQAWKPVDEVASLHQVRLSPMPQSGTSLPTPKR